MREGKEREKGERKGGGEGEPGGSRFFFEGGRVGR